MSVGEVPPPARGAWRETVRQTMRRLLPASGLPREVYVLVAVSFCVALGFGIVAPALPLFASSFDVSVTAASAVISVFALVRFVSATPAGWMVDRLGERVVLATGLAIVAVSSLFAGLAGSYVQLLVLRGIGGFGSAMFSVSALALLLRVVGPDQRGQAAGAFQSGFLIGGLAGPLVGGLVTGISMRLPFFVYAATLGAAVVVVVTMLARTHLADRPHETTPEATRSSWESLRWALAQRPYVTALVVNLATGFALFGLRSALVPLFVENVLRGSPSVTGVGLFVGAIVQLVLLVPAGRVSDERGRRPALVAGTALSVAGLVLLAFSGSEPVFLAAMAVLGAGAAFLGSAPAALVGDVTGGRRSGSVMAVFTMTSDLGTIVGPLVAGLIVDHGGSYTLAFLTGGALMLVAFATSVTLRRTQRTGART